MGRYCLLYKAKYFLVLCNNSPQSTQIISENSQVAFYFVVFFSSFCFERSVDVEFKLRVLSVYSKFTAWICDFKLLQGILKFCPGSGIGAVLKRFLLTELCTVIREITAINSMCTALLFFSSYFI